MNRIYSLHLPFLRGLLSRVFFDASYGAKVISVLDPSAMPSGSPRIVFEVLQKVYRASGVVPFPETVEQMITHRHADGAFTLEMRDKALRLVAKSVAARPLPREQIHPILSDMVLDHSIGDALDEAFKAYRDREYGRLREVIEDAYAKPRKLETASLGFSFRKQRKDFITSVRQGTARVLRIPTGFFDLDSTTEGGLGRGELGLIFAGRKVGKSMALVQIAVTAVLCGLVVIYVSLELGAEEIKRRFVASLTGIAMRFLADGGKETSLQVASVLDRIFADLGGDFIVEKFSPGKMTVAGVRDFSLDASAHYPGGPDLVIVDYADDLEPMNLARGSNSNDKGNEIYKDLRAMGSPPGDAYGSIGGLDAGVWTASQVQREHMHDDLLFMSYLASSIDKASKLDLGIAVCATQEEVESRLARLFRSVCRYAPWGRYEDVFGPYVMDFEHGHLFAADEVQRGRSVELWHRTRRKLLRSPQSGVVQWRGCLPSPLANPL